MVVVLYVCVTTLPDSLIISALHLLYMKHKEAPPSLSLALTLFRSPTALMDANGGVCRGKELTFMPLIRTHSPNTL